MGFHNIATISGILFSKGHSVRSNAYDAVLCKILFVEYQTYWTKIIGTTSAEAMLLFLICGVYVSYNTCVKGICEQPRNILACERPLRVIGTAFLILTSIVPRPFHAYNMLQYATILCCFVTELPSFVEQELCLTHPLGNILQEYSLVCTSVVVIWNHCRGR